MTDRKTSSKSAFALFFGNRGFFPASLIKGAREELSSALRALGHGVLMMDEKATRYGAVETAAEAAKYAEFLRRNRGRFQGVILCLPNFGNESGAVDALREAGVPILVQAYPDELDRMAPELRRDSFCGKLSVMDVFCQNGVAFSALKPHTAHPLSDAFAENVDHFDRVCRVVSVAKRMIVGAIGARTTPFKTVRCDETALQKRGITVETLDLSDIFARMKAVKPSSPEAGRKRRVLEAYSCWAGTPRRALEQIVRLGVVLDAVIEEYRLDALALRCWTELQTQLGISPCVVLGELNGRGIPAACEVDVGNAVTMALLSRAAGGPPACLDWNNNYGDDEDKCILFHCGPIPAGLMAGPGRIADHAILANDVGKGMGYGCNTGRIAAGDFTFGSLLTDSGRLKFYLGQGRFTGDPIPDDFFGCAGVAEIPNLQDALLTLGRQGHRHHVSVASGRVAAPLREALELYLGCDVTMV